MERNSRANVSDTSYISNGKIDAFYKAKARKMRALSKKNKNGKTETENSEIQASVVLRHVLTLTW